MRNKFVPQIICIKYMRNKFVSMVMESYHKPRYPQSFHLDEDGNSLVIETMRLGNYRNKSDLFRDAVKCLNKNLSHEITA